MSCSVPGVADADGAAGDLDTDAELFAVGAEAGAGVWPNKLAASKNEMAIAAFQFNIAFIVSWSPR
jgi:hypothetical protein